MFRKLFTPLRIGTIEVKNRILMPPMGMSFASDPEKGGVISRRLADYLEARAQGGAGLIMAGTAVIQPMPRNTRISLYDNRFVRDLKELVRRIQACNAKIGIELMLPGRQDGWSKQYKIQPVAPSAIPCPFVGIMPRELSCEEIKRTIDDFTDGAQRAKDAGVDLIELHGAHGYLISEFLSPFSNKRTDEYGGSTEGRARFAVEIIERIRDRLGRDISLSCRINGADNVQGGLELRESKIVAGLLEKAGLDLISVSAGFNKSYPVAIPPFDVKIGSYVDLAREIKNSVKVPVVAVGRINDPQYAEEILIAEKADLIAMGRALIADPGLPKKAILGDIKKIRKCIACNWCIGSTEAGRETTCLVNPAVGREREFKIVPAPVCKKALIAGGGLSGLKAAEVAASRGHEVHLWEEAESLGGQWRLAASAPHKHEFLEVINDLVQQIENLGVRIELGKKVTPEVIQEEKSDVLIIATGAIPSPITIPGIDRREAKRAWNILNGNSFVAGKKVLVIGGQSTGLEIADLLAAQGKEVTVADMVDRFATDMEPTVRFHLKRRLHQRGVKMIGSAKVKEIHTDEVVVERNGKKERWKGIDDFVLATGVISKPIDELQGVANSIPIPEIYVIGDAKNPGRGLDAIRDGAEVGLRV